MSYKDFKINKVLDESTKPKDYSKKEFLLTNDNTPECCKNCFVYLNSKNLNIPLVCHCTLPQLNNPIFDSEYTSSTNYTENYTSNLTNKLNGK